MKRSIFYSQLSRSNLTKGAYLITYHVCYTESVFASLGGVAQSPGLLKLLVLLKELLDPKNKLRTGG